ncbi:hypothetical protein B0H11DRAFT_1900948 [Mycena galericulata]|nr:hypothetical protein B0H11DRAFT_1900948 [Mycena galericulata]
MLPILNTCLCRASPTLALSALKLWSVEQDCPFELIAGVHGASGVTNTRRPLPQPHLVECTVFQQPFRFTFFLTHPNPEFLDSLQHSKSPLMLEVKLPSGSILANSPHMANLTLPLSTGLEISWYQQVVQGQGKMQVMALAEWFFIDVKAAFKLFNRVLVTILECLLNFPPRQWQQCLNLKGELQSVTTLTRRTRSKSKNGRFGRGYARVEFRTSADPRLRWQASRPR